MKKTNKNTKPCYIVDVTDCVTEEDFILAFAEAKVDNGIAISAEEAKVMAKALVVNIATATVSALFEDNNTVIYNDDEFIFGNIITATEEPTYTEPLPVKKPGFFKRIWNWITRK